MIISDYPINFKEILFGEQQYSPKNDNKLFFVLYMDDNTINILTINDNSFDILKNVIKENLKLELLKFKTRYYLLNLDRILLVSHFKKYNKFNSDLFMDNGQIFKINFIYEKNFILFKVLFKLTDINIINKQVLF
jgi:hypothetical protein